jgi:PhnB protein
MAGKVKPIPEGYHTVTPYLVVDNATEALRFYQRAFNAKEIERMEGPQGKIAHAELKIGDSIVMIADEMPGAGTRSPKSLGGTPSGIFLYLDDVDTAFQRAVAAGAKADQQPTDMFWGDRYGKLTDPFGHSWSMATRKEEVAPEEMKRRAQEAVAKMSQQQTRTAS